MNQPSPHSALPRSDQTPVPTGFWMHALRPLARVVIQRRFRVRLHGLEHIPSSGPVIFAGNHLGISDGPLLATFAPRPVHALTKVEVFTGRLGDFLRLSGQIPIDRFHVDPLAVKTCLRLLRDERAVAIFPEGRRGEGDLGRFHRGAGYFALATGAPVVPVIFIGTREPGGHIDSLPRRGGVVDLVFGAPYAFPAQPWPRTKEQVERASVLLREHLRATLHDALAMTGRELPGPLPAAEVEPDPATGVA